MTVTVRMNTPRDVERARAILDAGEGDVDCLETIGAILDEAEARGARVVFTRQDSDRLVEYSSEEMRTALDISYDPRPKASANRVDATGAGR